MRPRPFILLALALGLAGNALSVRAQDQPAQPPANSPAPSPSPDAKQNQAPAKTPVKEHKIITNDDLASIGQSPGSGHSDINLNGINNCDRFCFDQVHNTAGFLLGPDVQWKRDLLHGIEKVSEDDKWQTALAQLARAKAKFCDLNGAKNDALADIADPRKVTEAEIAIDEEYDRKFKAAQQELNAAYADVDAAMRGYGGIIVAFMNIQKQRAVSAPCVLQMLRYQPYRPEPDYPNDP